MKIILFLMLMVFSFTAFADKLKSVPTQSAIPIEKRLESLEQNYKLLSSSANIVQNYNEILEKTNNQLSLWFNPYGVMVGLLSVLLAALAIGVAFVIFKQSRDHKLQLEAERASRKDEFDKFLVDRGHAMKQLAEEFADRSTKQFDELIKEQKVKLQNSVTDSVEFTKIQKRIEELENQKASVPIGAAQTVFAELHSNDTLGALFDPPRVHKCGACGFGFKVRMNHPFTMRVGPSIFGNSASVTCPKCQNVDSIHSY